MGSSNSLQRAIIQSYGNIQFPLSMSERNSIDLVEIEEMMSL